MNGMLKTHSVRSEIAKLIVYKFPDVFMCLFVNTVKITRIFPKNPQTITMQNIRITIISVIKSNLLLLFIKLKISLIDNNESSLF
jgi:hypothetical protein